MCKDGFFGVVTLRGSCKWGEFLTSANTSESLVMTSGEVLGDHER